jgi:transcriptional regulator with XRE-family HTH domain
MSRLFSKKLRLLRQRHALTQIALAKSLGLSGQAHMANLEADRDLPSLDLVIRVARFFDVTTDYLLRDAITTEDAPNSAISSLRYEPGLPKLLGNKLRVLRLQKGWGQTEMARNLRLARRGYISNLETGRKTPSIELVVQIADLFEVTTDYMLCDTIPIKTATHDKG